MYDLSAAWAQIDAFEKAAAAAADTDRREREACDAAIAAEKRETVAAERERDVERERAEFYKALADQLRKKRSAGCWMLKVVTLGLGRCAP